MMRIIDPVSKGVVAQLVANRIEALSVVASSDPIVCVPVYRMNEAGRWESAFEPLADARRDPRAIIYSERRGRR